MPALLIACGSQHADKPPTVASGSPPPAPTPDAAAVAEYPPAPVRPTGCTLRGQWKDQPKELRVGATGKPFATVVGVKQAEATFGDGVFVEATTDTVTLAGFVDPAEVRLYARAPFTAAGWIVPGPKLPLHFRSAKGEQIELEIAMPAEVHARAPVRETQPCSSLAVDDTAKLEPRDAIDAKTISTGYLDRRKPIPLALEPGGTPVAELRYEESPRLDVLATTTLGFSRVVVRIDSLDPTQDVVVFGWVPTANTNSPAHGFGGSWGMGGDRSPLRRRPAKDSKQVTCATALPLVVELDNERWRVGSVAPNVPIEVLSGDDFVEIRLLQAHAELVPGARWLAKQAALAGCTVIRP